MSKCKQENYDVLSAISCIRKGKKRKFDETLDVGCELNLSKSDQSSLRGVIDMPSGTGKKISIAVFCADKSKFDSIKEAGADYVGSEDLVEEFKKRSVDCDVCLASPDSIMMVAKISKILKKLMPSPKSGTVSEDLVALVSSFKKGKLMYKANPCGSLHVGIGKLSFSDQDLLMNLKAFFADVVSKAPANKSVFVKRIFLSSTMGDGSYELNRKSFLSDLGGEK